MKKLPTNQPVVFELDRLLEYSDDAIMNELRKVAAVVPNGPLTTRVFQRHSRVSVGTVTGRLGSWDKALSSSGLSGRWDGPRAAKLAATKSLTDEAILEALTGLASRLGKSELTWRDVTTHLPFSGGIVKDRWGSVRAAFEAVGLASTTLGRRYTDEESFDNLLAVWTHYGRPPRFREMHELPSKVGTAAYLTRFRTWKKALVAFVERVNSDLESLESESTPSGVAQDAGQTSIVIHEIGGDRRHISLGVRYHVLERDRFKCVLCGDSPSISSACILHVDHIVPWSKGGRTDVQNLRSLCGSCNVGRGNRYVD